MGGAAVVVGAQWGDEGKGKVVDLLAARADAVVRFQGGHNAGHTLVAGGREHRLSLLPSGALRPGTLAVVGGGVLVDPWALLEERDRLEEAGFPLPPGRLLVAETASLILPLHARVDRARERARGAGALGTTGRGIGPACEDRAGRRALRVCDLADLDSLEERLEPLLHHNGALLSAFGEEPVDRPALLASLRALAPRLLPFAADVPARLAEARRAGARVLFEGAQGLMLDNGLGTYPFATATRAAAAEAALGSGVGPRGIGRVVGIAKAYATRVGAGPFPTELADGTGALLGERGREFGTVTGRRRRCGWLDAAALRFAVECSGIDALALTKIDVLDGLPEVRVAVAYELDGRRVLRPPPLASDLARARPIYETLPGWEGSSAGARTMDALPPGARAFARRVEELAGAPAALISTGRDREDAVELLDPFGD